MPPRDVLEVISWSTPMRHRQMTLCIKLLVELFEAVFFFQEEVAELCKRHVEAHDQALDGCYRRCLDAEP